ncbi:hypothetical protein [Gayadomonas joobiniege]|uniref:hypothetical protein n=1 Tax=Gayadomonas joobiniege TaxID=1234606 RepID=UPI000364D690|nr:hypothetical protein [Gayadomonas joobiniege]
MQILNGSIGLGIKAVFDPPGAGSFDAGAEATVSSVMSNDVSQQGIEVNAEAGIKLNAGAVSISGQAGKYTELIMPAGGTSTVTASEGSKPLKVDLQGGGVSLTSDDKMKTGATIGVIKVELGVDLKKLEQEYQ